MQNWWLKQFQSLLRATSTHRHPKAIAVGFALGIALGLIPKDNLFALGLCILLLCIEANILLAVVTCCVVGSVSTWADIFVDPIGRLFLEEEMLLPLWMALASIPIMPWFRWNNSIVLGSVVVGVASFVPAYLTCFALSTRLLQMQGRRSVSMKQANGILSRSDLPTDAEQRKRQIIDSETLMEVRHKAFHEVEQEVFSRIDFGTSLSNKAKEPKVVSIVPNKKTDFAFLTPAASFGSESISSSNSTTPSRATKKSISISENLPSAADRSITSRAKDADVNPPDNLTHLRETIIEIVRFRPRSPISEDFKGSSKSPSTIDPPIAVNISQEVPPTSQEKVSMFTSETFEASMNSPTLIQEAKFKSDKTKGSVNPGDAESSTAEVVVSVPFSTISPNSKSTADSFAFPTEGLRVESVAVPKAQSLSHGSSLIGKEMETLRTSDGDLLARQDKPREEALRYLLWHLSGVQRDAGKKERAS